MNSFSEVCGFLFRPRLNEHSKTHPMWLNRVLELFKVRPYRFFTSFAAWRRARHVLISPRLFHHANNSTFTHQHHPQVFQLDHPFFFPLINRRACVCPFSFRKQCSPRQKRCLFKMMRENRTNKLNKLEDRTRIILSVVLSNFWYATLFFYKFGGAIIFSFIISAEARTTW